MENNDQIYAAFQGPLWAGFDQTESFPNKRPMLAHYTSLPTFESIMRNDEFWLSNPLLMNDMDELRFGFDEAANAFRRHLGIFNACGGNGPRYNALCQTFEWYFNKFGGQDAFDTYCLCFCEHNPSDNDGLLSMWRGYGADGKGAAIVLDTTKLQPNQASPFIFEKVRYASRATRVQLIHDKLDLFASLIASINIPENLFYLPVHALFNIVQVLALFYKHEGFREEQEWRMVYVRDRDRNSQGIPNPELAKMFHYHVYEDRIEPKLKFKVGHIDGITAGPLRLEDLVDRIILGPLSASQMSILSVQRVLRILNKHSLVDKVVASTTPYRAQSGAKR